MHQCTETYHGSHVTKILRSTRYRIEKLRENEPELKEQKPPGLTGNGLMQLFRDTKNKGKVPVIAEIKPASPTTKNQDVFPEDAISIAKEMKRAGATALSILTEPDHFNGSIENLKAVRESLDIPILRKDFIIDEIQMKEISTDMILLIAGLLKNDLGLFIEKARSYGFEPLVEVHNKEELNAALDTPATIIGVNNRNLKDLSIDLATSEELIPYIKEYDRQYGTDHLVISESGVYTVDDARRMIQAGADALLIGTAIMKSGNVYEKTREIVEAINDRTS